MKTLEKVNIAICWCLFVSGVALLFLERNKRGDRDITAASAIYNGYMAVRKTFFRSLTV